MKTFDDFLVEVANSMRPSEVIFREFMLNAKRAGMTEAARINLKGDLPKGMEEGSMTAYHWLNGFVSAETKFANAILSARDKATV